METTMSCAYSRLSMSIEALIYSMTADGPAANLPPHIVLAGTCEGGILVIAILETQMRRD